MCTVLQHPLTATGTAVWCTGMRQVPPGVDSSNWCFDLSPEEGPLVSSHVRRAPSRCDTPPAIRCYIVQTATGY